MIDIDYALSKIQLSWSDIKWAYDNGKISWRSVVSFAKQHLGSDENYFVINELSKIGKDSVYRINEILCLLVQNHEYQDSSSMEKWILVELSSIISKKNNNSNPVDELVNIYEEYNCPSALDSFIPWRPARNGVGNPELYSNYSNYEKYYKNLEIFVNEKLDAYSH